MSETCEKEKRTGGPDHNTLVICQIRSELEILAFVKQVLVSRVANRNQKQVVRDREVQM